MYQLRKYKKVQLFKFDFEYKRSNLEAQPQLNGTENKNKKN